MAAIVANYFPDRQLMEGVIRTHLKQSDTVRLAIHESRIIGFSVASKHRFKTPFYPRPVNVIYQRMLYLDPEFLYRGMGLKLLALTMKDLFGWLWPFKRVVAVCRTQNPVVAKLIAMYNQSYPRYQQPVPADVRKFGESLLPMLDAQSIDVDFRLIGTLEEFGGADFTDTWNRYYHRRDDDYEKLMLHSAFEELKGRIINRGAFVLMIGYAKPLRFIRYLI